MGRVRDAGDGRPTSNNAAVVTPGGIEIEPLPDPALARVLSAEAVGFLAELERRFGPERRQLLALRKERQGRLDAGERPDFADTACS
jgi:malate synthase